MSRVIHFEIPADKPEELQKFYGGLLGWQFKKWDGPMPYWLITTGPEGHPGINGGLMARREPGQPPVNTVDVANVDEAITTAISLGGTNVVPKMAIPGVGWLAYCQDPEGNTFGMMQNDPAAQ